MTIPTGAKSSKQDTHSLFRVSLDRQCIIGSTYVVIPSTMGAVGAGLVGTDTCAAFDEDEALLSLRPSKLNFRRNI